MNWNYRQCGNLCCEDPLPSPIKFTRAQTAEHRAVNKTHMTPETNSKEQAAVDISVPSHKHSGRSPLVPGAPTETQQRPDSTSWSHPERGAHYTSQGTANRPKAQEGHQPRQPGHWGSPTTTQDDPAIPPSQDRAKGAPPQRHRAHRKGPGPTPRKLPYAGRQHKG